MRKKTFMKSSMIVMVFIIAGKATALLRDSMIAEKFGATYISDIYNFSIGMINLLITVSYGLTTTFIPFNAESIEKDSINVRNRFVNNIITISSIVTLVASVILILFARQIIYVVGHGFTTQPSVFASSVEITRIMLLSLVFVTIQSIVTGVLQSHKQFYEPAAMSFASNIVYVLYLALLAKKYGMEGFAIATVVGFIVQLLINVPKYKKLGYRYFPVCNFRDEKVFKMFKLMIPIVISTSVVQLNVFVNRCFATNLYFGATTILDFSNKINTLAYEVFAIGIAMIVYPTLSELVVKGNLTQYKKSLGSAITTIMMIMVPATFAIAMLRDPIINVIFERGAFTKNAANLTSEALLFYCPAMIAYGVRDILNKAFYSLKDVKTPMINSFAGIVINIIINLIIVKYMKVSGLTLAITISSVVTTMLMFWKINKKVNGMNLRIIFLNFIKICAASAAMSVLIFVINSFCNIQFENNKIRSIMSILISFVLGGGSYFIILYALKIKEYSELVGSIKNRISGKF